MGGYQVKILLGCEFSGTVRDAFIALGHEAMSCDLLPTEKPGPHYQGDIRDVLNEGWDMGIFFPPCTYVCSSGLHWNKRVPGRQQQTDEAIAFARMLWNSNIPKISMENPIGCLSTFIRKPDQIIQPYQFGHGASKSTCLWLKNLPKLIPTEYIEPRIVDGKKRWGNQTDSGQNNLPPTPDRWALRSLTYPGIAAAMATQWSKEISQLNLFQNAA